MVRFADLEGQDYKSGGNTCTEVMTQVYALIPAAVRPTYYTLVLGDGGAIVSRTPTHTLRISDYQSKKKLYHYQILT